MTRLLSKTKHIGYDNGDIRSAYINCIYGRDNEDGIIMERHAYHTNIKFLENGDIEVRNTLNGVYHDNTGPAYFVYENENEEPTSEKYYLKNGQCKDREEWLKRRDKTKQEPYADMLEEIFQEIGM